MSNRIFYYICLAATLYLIFPSSSESLLSTKVSAMVQSKATLTGTVVDANKLVVAGASIRVIETTSNFERTTTTNGNGEYSLPDLVPGTYRVEVEAASFALKELTGITIKAGESLKLDIEMVAGTVSTAVSGSMVAPMLQTESGALTSRIGQRRITELPLDARLFTEFLELTPGATRIEDSNSVRTKFIGEWVGPNVSVYGMRETANYFSIDGVPASNRFLNSLSISPSIDAINEFRVLTYNYSSEGTGYGGPTVNVETKSGTDNFHGSLFHFFRHHSLGARNPLNSLDTDGDGKMDTLPFQRSQYGATLGGPVVKSKTFFFTSFEHLRRREVEAEVQRVPTLAERNGDFRSLRGPGPDGILGNADDTGRVLNPDTGAEFLIPNLIPSYMIDPAARAVLSRIPLPNLTKVEEEGSHEEEGEHLEEGEGLGHGGHGEGHGHSEGNYLAMPDETSRNYQYLLRLDHTINSNNRIFGRFLMANGKAIEPFGSHLFSRTGEEGLMGFGQTIRSKNHNLALFWSHTFNPNLFGEARFGYNRVNYTQLSENANDDYVRRFGLQGISRLGYESGGYPSFLVRGIPEFGDISLGLNERSREYTTDYTLLWIKGAHTLKMGGTYKRIAFSPELAQDPRGVYRFGDTVNGSFSGDALADLMMGRPSSFSSGDINRVDLFGNEYAAFIETDWNVNRRLTLNLGMRYEYNGVLNERSNRLSTFDINTNTFIIASKNGQVAAPYLVANMPGYSQSQIAIRNSAGTFTYPVRTSEELGLPRGIVRGDKNNFAPRLGFAYDVFGNARMVVRGGYGIFYSRPLDSAHSQMGSQPPYSNYSAQLLTNPRGLSIANAGTVNPNNQPLIILNFPTDPNLRTGYVQQWNLTVERSFGSRFILSTSYVGSKGTKLSSVRLYNYPLPGATIGGRVAANFGANETIGLPLPGGGFTDGPAPETSVLGPAWLRLSNLPNAPGIGPVSFLTNNGSSTYHSGTVRVQNRLSKGLGFDAIYTFSKSLDNDSLGLGITDQNPFNKSLEKARSSFDVRHRFVASFLYELPFGRGRRFLNRDGLKNLILGGWQASGVLSLETGRPFTVNLYGDYYGIGALTRGRPDLVGDPNDGPRRPEEWFNTSAFALPPVAVTTFPYLNMPLSPELRRRPVPIGQLGNAGRNIVESDGLQTLNVALIKNFQLKENMRIQFRTEIFNLFNNVNYDLPNSVFTVPDAETLLDPSWNRHTLNEEFGRIEHTRTDSRRIQFALKFIF
jgi:hypothetical protein